MSTKPLNELLDEIEQYCEAATSEPWTSMGLNITNSSGWTGIGSCKQAVDVEFCFRARADLPRLVKELRERMARCGECDEQIEGSCYCFICIQVAKEKSEFAATRMKEELIKKVKEKAAEQQAFGLEHNRERAFALFEIAAELEKVEINV